MADMKISDLPAAPNVNDAQQFEVNDSGNSRRVTFAQVREKVKQLADTWYAPQTAQFQGGATWWLLPSNWNDLPAQYPYTGLVHGTVHSTASNGGPTQGGAYFVYQMFHSTAGGAYVAQLAVPYDSMGLLSWRNRNGGTWQPWQQVGGTSAFGRTLMNVADAAAARSALAIPAPTVGAISDATATGKALMQAANAAAARSAIGAGTGNSNVTLGYASNQAKPGNWGPNLGTETFGQLPWSRLTGVPDSVGAAPLPQALGVGSYVLGTVNYHAPIATVAAGATAPGASLDEVRLHHYSDGWENHSFRPFSMLRGHPGSVVPALAGTWRNMGPTTAVRALAGVSGGFNYHVCLFLRIA